LGREARVGRSKAGPPMPRNINKAQKEHGHLNKGLFPKARKSKSVDLYEWRTGSMPAFRDWLRVMRWVLKFDNGV